MINNALNGAESQHTLNLLELRYPLLWQRGRCGSFLVRVLCKQERILLNNPIGADRLRLCQINRILVHGRLSLSLYLDIAYFA